MTSAEDIAVADVLFGAVNPGGKLPVSFPRVTGQGSGALQPREHGRAPSSRRRRTPLRVTVSVTVSNTGELSGDEVVQLYIRDPVASVVQPVRRLRTFRRLTLAPRESTEVAFSLRAADIGFWTNDRDGEYVVETGEIEVFVGTDSTCDLMRTFTITPTPDRG